jgi:epoxyqueuosine reductase
MLLTDTLKDEAHRLGFALAGVTTPEPPPHWSVFQNWLDMGRHASMNYLADSRRADPRLVLPECKSILVLAMRYSSPQTAPRHSEQPLLSGRVASYAWGRDYHLVIPKKLKLLATFIEREAGAPVPHRGYTDTGPLLERDLAQRAGLGWIGKNTCLINPQLGSYFFLAELLLGIELEPDQPFTADRCGTCHRCIDSCPTGCILPDRTLDARRCISYLTIENKGEITPDLRPLMGNWVFGCDVCQMVCPWNQCSIPDPQPDFLPMSEIPTPSLVANMELTPQEFNYRFKESPVQRARRRGYLRNVAVALGNKRDAAAISTLERAARESEPIVGEHARWALEKIKKS